LDWNTITASAAIVGVIGGVVSGVLPLVEVRRNDQALAAATKRS
jgi:hypothetical protein